jgi:hypothetical protein
VSRFLICYSKCRYAESHYAECTYAECANAECRGITPLSSRLLLFNLRTQLQLVNVASVNRFDPTKFKTLQWSGTNVIKLFTAVI